MEGIHYAEDLRAVRDVIKDVVGRREGMHAAYNGFVQLREVTDEPEVLFVRLQYKKCRRHPFRWLADWRYNSFLYHFFDHVVRLLAVMDRDGPGGADSHGSNRDIGAQSDGHGGALHGPDAQFVVKELAKETMPRAKAKAKAQGQ